MSGARTSRFLPLVALILSPAFAAAQPAVDADAGADVKGKAAAPKYVPVTPPAVSCPDLTKAPASGVLCGSVASCEKYCPCACKLVKLTYDEWSYGEADDGATVCAGMVKTGPGMLSASDPSLLPLDPDSFHFLRFQGPQRATRAVTDGLRALDSVLGQLEASRPRGVSALVRNCHREHFADSVRECGYVLKGMVKLVEHAGNKEKTELWQKWENPMKWGMAWPGVNPHSGGWACDIVLLDAKGQKCFGYKTGAGPFCSIPERDAAEYLLDAVVQAGGRRLTYELWHFQWGNDYGTCVPPNCPWPALGHP